MKTIKYDHFKYGEMLAQRLKLLDGKQFYKASNQDALEELIEKISSVNGYVLIAINGLESGFNWSGTESLIERPLYSFCVLKNTDSNNSKTIFEAQENCKKIAEQIIASLLLGSENYTMNINTGLDFLDKDSFKIEGIGPIGDNLYGVELDFNFDQGTNFQINPEMWEK